MFTFETTDQKDVRRFRIAQFNGRAATVRSDGSTVRGHVRSVLAIKSSIPLRPSRARPRPRPTPRGQRPAFMYSWKTCTERRRPSGASRCQLSHRRDKAGLTVMLEFNSTGLNLHGWMQ